MRRRLMVCSNGTRLPSDGFFRCWLGRDVAALAPSRDQGGRTTSDRPLSDECAGQRPDVETSAGAGAERIARVAAPPSWRESHPLRHVHQPDTAYQGAGAEVPNGEQFEGYRSNLVAEEWESLSSDELRSTGNWPRGGRDQRCCADGTCRRAPPDILVTNYSMLEYMLIRPIESPMFDDDARPGLKESR